MSRIESDWHEKYFVILYEELKPDKCNSLPKIYFELCTKDKPTKANFRLAPCTFF